jgi:alpha-D-xyloside xylohydrolase
MKNFFLVLTSAAMINTAAAQNFNIKTISDNAVRVVFSNDNPKSLPDWIYVDTSSVDTDKLKVEISGNGLVIKASNGKSFAATSHRLDNGKSSVRFVTDADEYLYGLGQFQDGYTNIAGLPRRLTQVNTQISIPVVVSSKGYGIIWNSYAKTEFNMPENQVVLVKTSGIGETETVNVTSTEGGKQETRQKNIFENEISIPESGNYAILLDVGQKMARRHNLKIDGNEIIEMQNVWLPPTASKIVYLEKGSHKLSSELTENDRPVVYYGKVKNESSFVSDPSDKVDYTVIFGTPDEIIKTYRNLTGNCPLMPAWALGYIHCRERFHSQQEIIETANRFISEKIPVDVIVQDWQYWGNTGWNSMLFDNNAYPDPKQMVDYLHSKNIRMMLSVWSKIDKNSIVGKEMSANNYYIPNTDWIDFFSNDAANAYWRNFSEKLVPTGIDAWWQDATEPENDDLDNRMVGNGKYCGNDVRNVYPVLVNKTVYEGLRKDVPHKRPLILTRCGFLGIQRYGSALWSGDVGNDWETLRRQISAGLGMQAAGIPWWTYDAGGFFRPYDQYSNTDYINRMLRWIELSVYLPLMRVHGYMSDTEPWKYGPEAQGVIANCISTRKKLAPYIYSNAAEISFDGSTLMRPLVFDFANDNIALEQKYEYMFGKALLISPITEPNVTLWKTYLPQNKAGWYYWDDNKYYEGAQTIETSVDIKTIPVFAKGGSIVVVKNNDGETLDIKVFAGDNADFVLYEDDGESFGYENGDFSKTLISWNDKNKSLTLKPIAGNMTSKHKFNIKVVSHKVVKNSKGNLSSDLEVAKVIQYNGKETTIKIAL